MPIRLAAFALVLIFIAPALGDKFPRVVTGTITELQGDPIEDALIEYGYHRAEPEERETTRSGKDGSYTLTIHKADANYRLAVSARGYAPQYLNQFVPGPKEKPSEFSAKLRSVTTKRIRLVSSDGQPVAGASVLAKTTQQGFIVSRFDFPVWPSPLPGHDQHTISDSGGNILLDSLPPIPIEAYDEIDPKQRRSVTWLTLELNVRGRKTDIQVGQSQLSKIEPGDPIELVIPDFNIKPRGGIVRGRVVDDGTGDAIEDFDVVKRYSTHAISISNKDGQFSLGGNLTLGRGREVRVFKPGYAVCVGRPMAALQEDAEEFEFRLERHPSLKARLVDSNGTALPNVEIVSGYSGKPESLIMEWKSLDEFTDGNHGFENVLRVTSDSDGLFEIPEAPGKPATLAIQIPNFARTIVLPQDRSEVDEEGVVNIPLKKAGVITVSADRSTQLGKLATAAGIWFHSREVHFIDDQLSLDENGDVSFNRLAPGTYSVSLYPKPRTSPMRLCSKTITLHDGQRIRVELGKLDGNLTLSGRVKPFATVRISRQDANNAEQFSIKADVDGEFALSGLKQGKYSYSSQVESPSTGFPGGRAEQIDLQEDTRIGR